VILLASFQSAQAASILGVSDPAGCESKDSFLPNLLICGRSPATGACAQYTKPCNIGDLVETGNRVLIFVISLFLLIIPLFIMYYGAMVIIDKNWGGGFDIKKWKDRLFTAVIYFIFMLAAWLIVRTVVDIFQVDDRINSFLIDENGTTVKARSFNTN
jgi:hypothetical protein